MAIPSPIRWERDRVRVCVNYNTEKRERPAGAPAVKCEAHALPVEGGVSGGTPNAATSSFAEASADRGTVALPGSGFSSY
jgi:hypothetical protein